MSEIKRRFYRESKFIIFVIISFAINSALSILILLLPLSSLNFIAVGFILVNYLYFTYILGILSHFLKKIKKRGNYNEFFE